MSESKADILIIGAGPTGLLAANLLGQAGVSVLVVDRAAEPLDLPRAISIDDEGCRSIAAAGLGDGLRRIIRPGQGSRYMDEAGRIVGEVGPGPVEYGWQRRSNFHQPELEALLTAGLDRFDHVTLSRGREMTGFRQTEDAVFAEIGDETVEAKVMIAADGARSRARALLGAGFPGEAYAQDWIVLDLHRDDDQEPVSKFFCDPARPWVSIPTTYGGRRYEFMLLPGENAEEMLKLERLQALLAPVRQLNADDVMRAAVYTFEARVAEKWGEGRVWLAGDAAHLTPPFAGQGMNAGLRDATNLAWKAAMVAGGADPALLQTYEAERKAPAKAMVQLAVAMGEVVMPVGGAQVYRDALMAGLKRFPEARDYVLGMKFKPPPKYAAGAFLGLNDPDQSPASLIGRMLPNPTVRHEGADGPLDAHLGQGFTLIAQSGPGRTWLTRSRRRQWPIDVAVLALGDDASLPDPHGFQPLRAHRDQVMLVRPDRYVLGAFRPREAPAFLTELAKLPFWAPTPDADDDAAAKLKAVLAGGDIAVFTGHAVAGRFPTALFDPHVAAGRLRRRYVYWPAAGEAHVMRAEIYGRPDQAEAVDAWRPPPS